MKSFISILLTGLICLNNYNLSAQNAPISTIGTVETYNNSATVSITVTDFTNIGACGLLITYDSTMASATSVSVGPGVGYFYFIPNTLTPGQISVSWIFFQPGVPGLSLPDNSVFLNITFERTGYGYSAIEFDNSNQFSCDWADGDANELNDIPFSTYYIDGSIDFKRIDAPITSAPYIEECEGLEYVDIPVTVSDFGQIGAFNLTIQYDSLAFLYQSFTNNSGFPGLDIIENSPGTIVIEGVSSATEGENLANNTILFTLHFGNQGESTALYWLDLGESCKYMGPAPAYEPRNDLPQSSFYINGAFNELPLPADGGNITSPSGGLVCRGESNVTFSISPIDFADSYEWTIPEGATIDSGMGTSEISVSFNDYAISGDIGVYGINECGDGVPSTIYTVTVEVPPAITFQPVSPDTVYAGDGEASFSVTASGSGLAYQWQEYSDIWVDVTDDGVYSGTATSSLTITNPPISMNGYHYRCIVSGNCEPLAISDGNAVLSVVLTTGYDERNFDGEDTNNDLQLNSFPNPFSDQITFALEVPSKGIVKITINNIYGENITRLSKQIESKGHHELLIDTKHLSQGIYITTITFQNENVQISNTFKIVSGK